MLTALGVGGLAVALALQEPLANFSAGLFITLAGQIRVSDYVKLDSGQDGYVVDFSWRSTRLRMLANNLVVSRTRSLRRRSSSIITCRRGGRCSLRSASITRAIYGTWSGCVMQKVTGAVPKFEPFIRYHLRGLEHRFHRRKTRHSVGYHQIV
jgi:hypothetical protein